MVIFEGVWPLDAAQGWFEDLPNLIWDTLEPGFNWLYDELLKVWQPFQDLIDGISQGLGDLWNYITAQLPKDLVSLGSTLLDYWDTALITIGEGAKWLGDLVFGWVEGLARWITDCFYWVKDRIDEATEDINKTIEASHEYNRERLETQLDGGFEDLGDWLVEGLTSIGQGFVEALKTLAGWLWDGMKMVADGFAAGVRAVQNVVGPFFTDVTKGFIDTVTDLLSPGSPPEELDEALKKMAKALQEDVTKMTSIERESIPPLESLLAASAGVIVRPVSWLP